MLDFDLWEKQASQNGRIHWLQLTDSLLPLPLFGNFHLRITAVSRIFLSTLPAESRGQFLPG